MNESGGTHLPSDALGIYLVRGDVRDAVQPNYAGGNRWYIPESVFSGPVPVPELREIAGWGFDFIAQFRGDLVQLQLGRSLGSPRERRVAFSPDELSAETQDAVRDALEGLEDSHPGGFVLSPEWEEWPREWLLRLGGVVSATIDEARETPELRFEMRLELEARQYETVESWSRREEFARRFSARPGEEPLAVVPSERTASIMSGRLEFGGPVELDVDPEIFRARVKARFAGATPTPTGGSELFADLVRDVLSSEIAALIESFAGSGSPPIPICQEIAIGGGLRHGEAVGLDRLSASVLHLRGNRVGDWVLAIVGVVGGSLPDSSSVTAFLSDRNFAHYSSTRVIRSIADTLWRRDSTPQVIRSNVPAEFALRRRRRRIHRINGRAEIEMEFTSPPREVRMQWRSQGAGVAIFSQHTVKLLTLYDEDGRALPREDYEELTRPEANPSEFHVAIHGIDQSWSNEEAREAAHAIARTLLEPLLRPLLFRLYFRDVEGQTSVTLGSVTRGNLA